MDEAAIIAAVDRLNEQLQTLPDTIGCSVEDLYPDFDYPDCGPEVYLALVEDEARQIRERIEQAAEVPTEDLQRLLAMLVECAVSLRLAGVTTLFEGDLEETALAGEAEIGDDPQEPPASSNGHDPNW
jgi:hypothetical protein